MARRKASGSPARSKPRGGGRKAAAGNRPVRFAVVGLGHIAQMAVLPAFAHARKRCELAALVSDDPAKLSALGRKYKTGHLATYEQYDELLSSGAIDAVYLALPNDQHRDFAVRAASAGVHVLCEKPLALTVADCSEMILAAQANDVLLMTAYRLHFERANMRAVEILKSGRIGEPRFFHSLFGMQVRDSENIRLQARHGGGPLFDLGVYCINAARYLFRAEPTEVVALDARGTDPRFVEVPEMTSALMRFPGDRLASFTCSFGSADVSVCRVIGTRGELELEPAFEYAEALRLRWKAGGRSGARAYPKRDQFAPELLTFAECIQEGRELESDGYEGLADVRVINALQESARSGAAVKLSPLAKTLRPSLRQERRLPPVEKREQIHARSPSRR